MKQATHFIEVIKNRDGNVKQLSVYPFIDLKWSQEANERLSIETIAIFKIYPKNKKVSE